MSAVVASVAPKSVLTYEQEPFSQSSLYNDSQPEIEEDCRTIGSDLESIASIDEDHDEHEECLDLSKNIDEVQTVSVDTNAPAPAKKARKPRTKSNKDFFEVNTFKGFVKIIAKRTCAENHMLNVHAAEKLNKVVQRLIVKLTQDSAAALGKNKTIAGKHVDEAVSKFEGLKDKIAEELKASRLLLENFNKELVKPVLATVIEGPVEQSTEPVMATVVDETAKQKKKPAKKMARHPLNTRAGIVLPCSRVKNIMLNTVGKGNGIRISEDALFSITAVANIFAITTLKMLDDFTLNHKFAKQATARKMTVEFLTKVFEQNAALFAGFPLNDSAIPDVKPENLQVVSISSSSEQVEDKASEPVAITPTIEVTKAKKPRAKKEKVEGEAEVKKPRAKKVKVEEDSSSSVSSPVVPIDATPVALQAVTETVETVENVEEPVAVVEDKPVVEEVKQPEPVVEASSTPVVSAKKPIIRKRIHNGPATTEVKPVETVEVKQPEPVVTVVEASSSSTTVTENATPTATPVATAAPVKKPTLIKRRAVKVVENTDA